MLEVGARVLLIDPMMGHLGDVDSYKDQNIRKALGPLASLTEKVNGVVLGIMHLNKRECLSIVSRVGGSVGFVAAARSVLLAAQDPESEDQGNGVLVHAKCNVAPHAPTIRYQIESANYDYEGAEIKTSRIVWGSEAGHIHVGDVLRPEAPGSDEPGQKAEAKEWLLALLENGARPSKEVFKLGESEGGFSKSTLKRAKKALKIDSKREGFGEAGQWVWGLREGDGKGGQKGSKGDHAQEDEPLCESHCKKSQKSNDLPKEGQGSANDTLSDKVEPLSKAGDPLRQAKGRVIDVDA